MSKGARMPKDWRDLNAVIQFAQELDDGQGNQSVIRHQQHISNPSLYYSIMFTSNEPDICFRLSGRVNPHVVWRSNGGMINPPYQMIKDEILQYSLEEIVKRMMSKWDQIQKTGITTYMREFMILQEQLRLRVKQLGGPISTIQGDWVVTKLPGF